MVSKQLMLNNIYKIKNIVQNDTTEIVSDNTNVQNTTQQSEPTDSFIRLIQQGYDATSYYYANSQKNAPLQNNFLNPAIFKINTTNKQKQTLPLAEKTHGLVFKETDILLLVSLILISGLAYIRISTKNYIKKLIASVFSFVYSRTLYNEHTKLLWIKDFVLLVVFYAGAGILATQILKDFYPESNKTGIDLYYLTPIIILGINLIYQFVVKIIGVLSGTSKLVSEYLFYFNNSLKFLGVFNLVVIFPLIFGPQESKIYIIYFIFFTYITTYLLRVYKILLDFLSNRFSLFYYILYFCALEIVPIMMLIKLFSTIVGTKFAI